MQHICIDCGRSFKSAGGLKIHQHACKKTTTSQRSNASILDVHVHHARNENVTSINDAEDNSSDSQAISNFTWGDREGNLIIEDVNQIYEKVVFWRKNIFKLPSGTSGEKLY